MWKKMPFSYTNFLKWEGGLPPPTPFPRSVASLPRFAPPLLKNPDYATGAECIALTIIEALVVGLNPALADFIFL